MQALEAQSGKPSSSNREDFRNSVVCAAPAVPSVAFPSGVVAAMATQRLKCLVGKQVNALETKLFFMPSFAIYGSVAGFYDYGPNGCKVKQNITQYWRQHFVLEENMLEVRQLDARKA